MAMAMVKATLDVIKYMRTCITPTTIWQDLNLSATRRPFDPRMALGRTMRDTRLHPGLQRVEARLAQWQDVEGKTSLSIARQSASCN